MERCARAPCGDATLNAILDSARRHNVANGVSGVLLFHRGRFVQAIEGERDPVAETYARIVNDTRHENCVPLGVERIDERTFGDWTMGRLPVSGEDGAAADTLLTHLREFSPSVAHPAATAVLQALSRKLIAQGAP